MMTLKDCIKASQTQLFRSLLRQYNENSIARQGKFLLVRGDVPVLLVAHLDTVHEEPVHTICISEDGSIMMSPQGIGGDDRCGVYALQRIYAEAEKKPWLLFTCDEEIGGHGAKAFVEEYEQEKLPQELANMKMLVEIDRRGRNDAVFYDCGNPEFEDYINSHGFLTQYGSFSDISLIAPVLGVAAVNLSSGYYDAHTRHEYINCRHLENTIVKVGEMVAEASQDDFSQYDYQECDWLADWQNYGYAAVKQNLSKGQRRIYKRLMEFFAVEEIERYRQMYGDGILQQLYEDVREYCMEG
ncbi:hypothetical protein FZ041_11110 [Selenomonas caprae]|uniref:M28 family peptidase n=1 Tax=Selenomonas caprae TaxID=2606905 RepID=A0A5D6WK83_9FIRM|nr:hypothetical protein [Selenomonas caprae]TYZ27545.1 hypothetical protein FZ041_11110 [Selenomonas caprae]